MTREARITLRTAEAAQAPMLHALIAANREEGHLLPRALEELSAHAGRFVVAVRELCAFTHTPGYFSGMGFSIVPHLWLSEKIFTDCVKCPIFRRCGQYAMVVALDEVRDVAVQVPLIPHHA
jgi:N-acetylglutamate synthase-like GNAT family acetyltransferase